MIYLIVFGKIKLSIKTICLHQQLHDTKLSRFALRARAWLNMLPLSFVAVTHADYVCYNILYSIEHFFYLFYFYLIGKFITKKLHKYLFENSECRITPPLLPAFYYTRHYL